MLLPRLVALLLLSCLVGFASGAANLPPEEVESLRQIGRTLKQKWDFSVDPCSRSWGWDPPETTMYDANAVDCDCNFLNNTICHVVNMWQ